MFTTEQRDRTRAQLLAHAEADDSITGFAYTGSHATGDGDRWSDTDIVLAVRGEVAEAVRGWTTWIHDEFGARHHWDLGAGGTGVIRVFLLPGWVELDLTFAPESEFGARGPAWRTLFGTAHAQPPFPPPDRNTVIGFAWHHALRDQLITLACLRLDLPTAYSKGAHLLPDEVTAPLESTLVRSLTDPELRRALTATITATAAELNLSDPQLVARLRPMLTELT